MAGGVLAGAERGQKDGKKDYFVTLPVPYYNYKLKLTVLSYGYLFFTLYNIRAPGVFKDNFLQVENDKDKVSLLQLQCFFSCSPKISPGSNTPENH